MQYIALQSAIKQRIGGEQTKATIYIWQHMATRPGVTVMDIHDLIINIDYKLNRIKYHKEYITNKEQAFYFENLIESLNEVRDQLEDSHDDCYTQDYIDDHYVSNDDYEALQKELEESKKKTKKTTKPTNNNLIYGQLKVLKGGLND